MSSGSEKLKRMQRLVMDVARVERNHTHLGSDRHENVVEHSFSVAVLCWRLYDLIKPPLDFAKVMKYALIHDFPERGVSNDTNTFADEAARHAKKEREEAEIAKMKAEFGDFAELAEAIEAYERKDDEALFVWSVDKMQAIVLGGMDGWRPYAAYRVTWKQFCDKCEEFAGKCSPYLKDVFVEICEEAKKTYYDRPQKK